jgi:hypothetical protein
MSVRQPMFLTSQSGLLSWPNQCTLLTSRMSNRLCREARKCQPDIGTIWCAFKPIQPDIPDAGWDGRGSHNQWETPIMQALIQARFRSPPHLIVKRDQIRLWPCKSPIQMRRWRDIVRRERETEHAKTLPALNSISIVSVCISVLFTIA